MTKYIQSQIQQVKNPDGEMVDILIEQIFNYSPAVWYLSNGDPGWPESYDEDGDAKVTQVKTGDCTMYDWIDNGIDWEKFAESEFKLIDDGYDQ